MLIDVILQLSQSFIIWVIELVLPSSSFLPVPNEISDAVANIVSYAGGWNNFLPVYESVQILHWTLQVMFWLAIWFVFKKFVLGSIPFIGGSYTAVSPDVMTFSSDKLPGVVGKMRAYNRRKG